MVHALIVVRFKQVFMSFGSEGLVTAAFVYQTDVFFFYFFMNEVYMQSSIEYRLIQQNVFSVNS